MPIADPPTKALAQFVRSLFANAASHFGEAPLFYTSDRAGIGRVWAVFSGQYDSEFSNWKKGVKEKNEHPRGQLKRTQNLICILDGRGVKLVETGKADAYGELIKYWNDNHAPNLASVLTMLKSYEAIVSKAHTAELKRRSNERLLASVTADTPLPDPLGRPPEPVRVLEDGGQRPLARQWLIDNWTTCKSWNNLAHFIRLIEQSGGGADGLDQFNRLKTSMDGEPSEELNIALRYFVGRVFGQIGKIQAARERHEKNLAARPPSRLYQLKSQFELAQLAFRVEDFKRSKEEVVDLDKALAATPNAPTELKVDVLKFLAFFERLHVVFDQPYARVVLDGVATGSAEQCMEHAGLAIKLATDAAYFDGIGWGHVVRALAWEGKPESEKADDDFGRAADIHSGPHAHGSSIIYTHFYHSGMLRRRRDFPAAKEQLDRASARIGDRPRSSYNAELLTQRGLIAEAEGDVEEAKRSHIAAIRIVARDPEFRTMEWGIVKRLRAICAHYGRRLEDVIDDAKPTART